MVAQNKNARRYVWFAIDDNIGRIYGLHKPEYGPWELSNTRVTYQQFPRFPKMPESFRTDVPDHRRASIWNRYVTEKTTYERDCGMFHRLSKQVESFKFANKNLRIICTRVGSKNCPAKLDWVPVLRSKQNLSSGSISFIVKENNER